MIVSPTYTLMVDKHFHCTITVCFYIWNNKKFYFQYSSVTNIFSAICIDWLQNIFRCIKKIRICLWACGRLDDSHLLFTHWVVAVAGSFITTCSENLIAYFYQDEILSIVFTPLRISEHFIIHFGASSIGLYFISN